MKTIHKYVVPIDDQIHSLDLPRPAEIVHVGMQGRSFCFWAVVDPLQADTERRYFKVVGTGHIWPAAAWHIGSTQDGIFVWHLLELAS